MKRFLHSKNFKATAAAFVLLGLLCALSHAGINPLLDLADCLSSGVSALEAAAEYSSSADEAAELRSENARLRAQLADCLEAKRENEALRKYFNLGTSNPDYTLLPAEVIRRSADCVTLTLDAGSGDGIEINDPVIGESGLVGRVSAVRADYCTVTTLLSPETKAAVRGAGRDYSAIACGSGGADGKNVTRLTSISQSGKISEGDVIVTSGEGTAYPKGLLVGSVTKVESTADVAQTRAEVELYEDPCTLNLAAVITDF